MSLETASLDTLVHSTSSGTSTRSPELAGSSARCHFCLPILSTCLQGLGLELLKLVKGETPSWSRDLHSRQIVQVFLTADGDRGEGVALGEEKGGLSMKQSLEVRGNSFHVRGLGISQNRNTTHQGC